MTVGEDGWLVGVFAADLGTAETARRANLLQLELFPHEGVAAGALSGGLVVMSVPPAGSDPDAFFRGNTMTHMVRLTKTQ
jgi:hypothetical protein